MTEKHLDSKVIIIGTGPAGLTAAIQLKRLGIDFLLLNKTKEIGGLLRNANLIENFPSYPKGIKAKKLIQKFENHLKELEIRVNSYPIDFIDFRNDKFYLESKTENSFFTFNSDYLIIATGTKPKSDPNIIFSKDAKSMVKFEIESIFDEKGKSIAIVGAGDAAFDYSINLSKKNKIVLLNRSNKIRALPVLIERVEENKNIKYFENSFIVQADFSDDSFFLSIRSETIESLICDYLVLAIGREPNFPLSGTGFKENEEQLIAQKRLFLIGDLVNGIARQSSIAIGDGMRAAMMINSEF